MISKHHFIRILIRVFLIMVNCILVAFLYYNTDNYVMLTHLFLLVILQSWFLSRYLNRTNKTIKHFLESLKNDDFFKMSSSKIKDNYSQEIFSYLDTVYQKIRKTETELTKQLAYFNAVMRNVPGGIITIINDDKIDLYSKSVLEIFNKRNLSSIHDFESCPNMLNTIKTINPGDSKTVKIETESEIRVLSLSCSEIRNEEQIIKIISFDDIKSKLDEQEIQSWQKLIRVLTHEMMNSFSPLISASETLQLLVRSIDTNQNSTFTNEDLVKFDKIDKGFSIINERTKGIKQFIEKYRQLTKLPKPKLSEFSVKELLDEIVLMHEERIYDLGVHCNVEVTPEDLQLLADRNLVSQVLINLIKNAFEAVENTEKPHIILKSGLRNNRVFISILDNGSGIDKDDIHEIFIPFFTTKKDGSGIGLSLSKQIMHLHQGEIICNQHESQTEFLLIF